MKKRAFRLLMWLMVLFFTASCLQPFTLTPSQITSSSLPVHLLWQVELNEPIVQKPILYDSILVVLSVRMLYALDIDTGQILWNHSTRWRRGHFPIAVQDNVVVLGDTGGYLTVLQLQTGEILWQADLGADNVDYVRDVDIEDDIVYSGGQPTYVEARRLITGEILWTIDVNDALQADMSMRGLRLGVKDGMVFAFGSRIHVIDANTGRIIRVLDLNIGGGQILDDKWYGANIAYQLPTFEVILQYQSPTFKENYGSCALFRMPLELRNDVIYASGYCGGVFAIDAEGEIIWQYETMLDAESPIALYHGNVYALFSNGQIHAIDSASGENRGILTTDGTIPGVIQGELSARGLNANDSALVVTFGNRQIWAFSD
jgi:outer membrane protein assembly factor BamB